ncbi:maleylpyruvate isomerase family mycothiol-dependent enzyme [Nonomuraea basaltis]|uniref:maleylpyruvate isomerase family mycothiol-dependent enzyme n=1 Tax=Nonomuraea basaltis TaxID=2495887 RepID=UPI00110C5AE2|nr:maleylpyruvate isomerase family mycothiol-dependent enzyme [Nonomuraea basaltis]TMR98818.1 maleylpyruvate isomerase family mycothiol-dependent enzyme [Nonomuraea basaltis]
MTIFGPVIDVRPLFPREREAMLDLLRALSPADWAKPTICPGWNVHDVAGHVLNDYMRRLSGMRDGHGGAVFANDETLPAFIARTNEEFVRASRQLSPQLLIELLDHLGPQLDAVWAARDLEAPAGLNVSWAATDIDSATWLDIGREYTEFWVHQQQVRDAVSVPGATQPDLMAPALNIFARALPYTLRMHERPEGTVAHLDVHGPAGGQWSTAWQDGRWRMVTPGREPAARVSMDQDTFWRLATRGITVEEARERSKPSGDPELTAAMTTLLAVVA